MRNYPFWLALRCRGLSKLEGFFNAPELTTSPTELFRDDWYYPGDMASFDSDGYIHLKGRESDLIRLLELRNEN
jgi:acyl-coenzyme A synthetase/AMP-(fatty) acid ligase